MSISILGSASWQPSREFVLEHLHAPSKSPLKLHTFPRGIDNAHIDVLLMPELVNASRELIRALIEEQLHHHQRNEGIVASSPDVVAAFNEVYSAICLSVAQHARRTSRKEIAQLFQLALLKLMLSQADAELQRLKKELENVRGKRSSSSGSLDRRYHQQLLTFSRFQNVIRYKVCNQAMRVLSKIEHTGLRKLRKSVLGVSWPVAEDVLFNPLLQLGGLGREDEFLHEYPLILFKSDNFVKLNKLLVDALSAWLPAYTGYPPVSLQGQDYRSLPTRRDKGELPGYAEVEWFMRSTLAATEYKDKKTCWLDNPANLTKLLGGEDRHWPLAGPWQHNQWPVFQRALVAKLEKALSQAGLLEEALAAAVLPDICRESGLQGHARLIYEYLYGARTRKVMLGQLQSIDSVKNAAQLIGRLDTARKSFKQMPVDQRYQLLVKVMGGFARLRRDLKLSWSAYKAMNLIRLIGDQNDLELSRSNALLQEFSASSDRRMDETSVVGHAILKADLRGSTVLTAQMREKDLNPAAYFSKNLFDPINRLLEDFAAIKVFVEGDAVILTILDYAGHQQDGLVIARACGLAYKILEVVRNKNMENRHLGLPELELGVGITYIDEAPTYLFDQGHKITISPAINRADRLSSCAPNLHQHKLSANKNGWGVEVVLPTNRDPDLQGQEALLRYNVNGIELDLPAFEKLGTELILKKVKSRSMGGRPNDKYYVGRFPDIAGKTNWLVVREAVVSLWDGRHLLENPESGQKFHEIVADSDMINKVRSKLSLKRKR